MTKTSYIACMLLVFSACTQTDSSNTETLQQSSNELKTIPSNPLMICKTSTAKLVHAAWVKDETQPPHLLIVTSSNGETTEFELGIDRSPDFFFRESERIIVGYHFYHAHSRLLAYSCKSNEIQELDLSPPVGFEAQDAQSGMINGLRQSDNGSLVVSLVDTGEIEFRTSPSGFIRAQ